MVHVPHQIIFSWRRPKMSTAEELVTGKRILENRDRYIAQFRSQLEFKPPKINFGKHWLETNPVEFIRVIEPFDLLLAFIIVVLAPLCAILVARYVDNDLRVDLGRVLTVLAVLSCYLLLYFGSLFLAFRAYRGWLDDLARNYQRCAPVENDSGTIGEES